MEIFPFSAESMEVYAMAKKNTTQDDSPNIEQSDSTAPKGNKKPKKTY